MKSNPSIHFDDVKELKLSEIEITDMQDSHVEQRALEIITSDGRSIITFTGENLRVKGINGREI